MAFDYTTVFVAPTSSSGLSNGTFAAVDEWPPSTDVCYLQLTGGNSGTSVFGGFDLSGAGGDKKGFRLYFKSYSSNSSMNITAIRIKQDTTTLHTFTDDIDITQTSNGAARIHVLDIPDSAFSGDPDIDNMSVEFDVTNTTGSNNRLHWNIVRISKSPFTAAQEAELPSTLVGQDYSCYRASDMAVVGAVDGETVILWPDASGNGRHLIRFQTTGTAATYEDDTIDYLNWANASATRFSAKWETAVTGNHIWHAHVWTDETTGSGSQSPVVFSTADVDYFAAIGNKNILGLDWDTDHDAWVMMSGDGSAGAHLHGGTPSTSTWYRITEWVQDAGNEHMWVNDDASPIIDDASGANDLLSYSVGDRENFDRPWQGRIAELWVVDGAGISEADIDTARDEWVNGIGATPVGSATASVAVTATASGTTKAYGDATASIAVTATASGTVPGVTPVGNAIGSVAVTVSAAGKAKAYGAVSASISVTALASGSTSDPLAIPTGVNQDSLERPQYPYYSKIPKNWQVNIKWTNRARKKVFDEKVVEELVNNT